jgi:hypothetical protein
MAKKKKTTEPAVGFSAVCPVAQIFAGGKRVDTKNAQLLEAMDSTGGGSLATARIRIRLKEPYTEANLHPETDACEIVLQTQVGKKTREKVVFWGKFSGQSTDIGENESVIIEARQAPYHFGKYVDGMIEYNAKDKKHQTLPQAIEFNPTVNFSSYSGKRIANTRGLGVVRGNMNDVRKYGKGECFVFLDPASVYTPQARRYATSSSETRQQDKNEGQFLAADKKWTLKEAVYTLCWTLNEEQENFKNPSRDELVLLDGSQVLLHDIVIPLGTFLPEALDRVLNPFGYAWRVDYVRKGVRKLAVFQRGVGPKKNLKLQKPGENLDLKKTNMENGDFACGNQSLINRVEAFGDFKLFESTFELKKAWATSLDNIGEDQKVEGEKDLAGVAWVDRPQHHRVCRDYVLNEAGDYNGVRSEYREPYNFKEVFGVDTVPRRRRFLPCITLGRDRLPLGANGYFVEYHDGSVGDGEDGWRDATGIGFEILSNECGVRFTGATLPPELSMQTNLRVRITASVYSDERIKHTTKPTPNSPQPDIAPTLIDVTDRFHYRKIHKDSQFLKNDRGDRYENSQVDDTKRMIEFAERIVAATDHLDVRGTAVIPNLDGDSYDLGDIIEKIEGRDISLDAGGPSSSPLIRHPQVVGITYDYTNQKRILALEVFRDTRFV